MTFLIWWVIIGVLASYYIVSVDAHIVWEDSRKPNVYNSEPASFIENLLIGGLSGMILGCYALWVCWCEFKRKKKESVDGVS